MLTIIACITHIVIEVLMDYEPKSFQSLTSNGLPVVLWLELKAVSNEQLLGDFTFCPILGNSVRETGRVCDVIPAAYGTVRVS